MLSRFWMSAIMFQALFGALAIAQANESVAGQSADPAPPVAVIVNRIRKAQADARPQVAYQEIRKYRIFPSANSSAASEVVAAVDFRLPGSKNFAIQQPSDNARANEVVRRILEHESESANQGRHVPSSAVNEENYDFSYLGAAKLDGQPCYLLQLTPKKKEKNLLSGQAWVDSQSFLIRQLEGDLVKSPSWWIKKVHVKLNFADVDGVWVQTATWARAEVRVFGSQTLTSELVDHRNAEVVASRTPTRLRFRRSTAVLPAYK